MSLAQHRRRTSATSELASVAGSSSEFGFGGGSSYDGGGGGRAGGLTVTHIGGARELVALIRRGEIDAVRQPGISILDAVHFG
jgi:hypothetical protein